MTRRQLTDGQWKLIVPLLPIGEYGPYPERLRDQFEGVIRRFGTGARWREIPGILVTHNVRHAMMVGDHFAVLIHGQKADDFRKGERTREEITDLMAGGEAMAHLEAGLARMQLEMQSEQSEG